MVNVYRSMAGVVNFVFTAAMVLLAVRFWLTVNIGLRSLIVLGIMLFPVLQPLVIYLRSKRIVSKMPENMEMRIDAGGITVTAGDKSSQVKFTDLKSVTRIRGMLILYTKSKQGFILNKETLAGREKELYAFLGKQAGKKSGKKKR